MNTGFLYNSLLFSNGGYQLLNNLIPSLILVSLQNESTNQFEHAVPNKSKAELPLLERGGQPSRQLYSGSGDRALQEFYHDANLISQLQACTGLNLKPTGEQGSYSYYLHKGDYLGFHRDFHSCDVTLITTLYDQCSNKSKGGMLCLYPSRAWEPLNQILKTPLHGATLIRLKQGDSLVLLGGVVPHWVLPMQENEKRVTALLCYCASELIVKL